MAELFGIELPDLDEGWTGLEAIAAIKSIDEEGRPRIQLMVSEGLTIWEAVGIMRCLEHDLTEHFSVSLEDTE